MNMFKFMRFFQIRRSLLVGILFIFCGALGLHIQATHAAVCDFQSVGTSDFNLDANWSCGHQPTAGDVATIRAGTSTIMTASSTFAALNATGTIDALNFNLTVTGNAEVAATGYVSSTTGVINLLGAVSSTGIIGASTQTGNMLFGTSLVNNGTIEIGSATVTSTGNITNNSVGTINGGTGNIMAGSSFIGAGTFNPGTGTVKFFGGGATVVAPGTFYNVISATGANIISLSHNTTILGSLSFLNVGSVLSNANSLTIAGVATVIAGATVSSTSGYLTFAGDVTNAGTIASNSGNMTLGANFTNSGTFLIGSGTASTTADLINTGTVSSTGAGTLSFRGLLAQVLGGSGSINLYNFTLNKTAGTVSLAGNVTTTGAVNLTSGNLAIGARRFAALGAEFNNDGAIITLGDSGTLHHPIDSLYFTNSGLVDHTANYTNGSQIYLAAVAPARNLDASVIDSFTVPLTMAAGAGSDAETITFTETAPASGLFVNAANLLLVTGTVVHNNGQLELTSSGLATAAYTNIYDPSDTSSTTATMNAAALSSNVDNNTGGGGAIGSSGSSSLPPLVTQNQSGPSGSAANLNNLKTLGISIHALVKLPDDGKASTQEDSAVYYIGTDGMRHAFPNSKIYFTWYTDFSQVQLVSATQLASIPLGKNVTYKPGVRMVKFTTDPKVYAVDKGGVLRYVTTEAVATALYGSAWNTMIDDLSDAFFTNYTFGTNISSGADFNPSALKASVKLPSESLGM